MVDVEERDLEVDAHAVRAQQPLDRADQRVLALRAARSPARAYRSPSAATYCGSGFSVDRGALRRDRGASFPRAACAAASASSAVGVAREDREREPELARGRRRAGRG